MPHKSSFDQVAKQKAIDENMPEEESVYDGPARGPDSPFRGPEKGSVKERAATAGNMAARGLNKLSNMPTPVDALKSAGKSFKKTLQNKATRELEQEGDPRALQEKRRTEASKKLWDDRVKRGDA